ncbi:sensor histidine kinase [Mariniluteicoccus endophyticus]
MSDPDRSWNEPSETRTPRPGQPDVTSEGIGWRGDLILTALALITSFAFTALVHGVGSARMPFQFLITLFMVVPMALRRRYPLAMLAIVTFGGMLHVAWETSPLPCLGVVPLVVFSVARFVEAEPSRWAVVVGLVASVIGPLSWANSGLGWDVNSLVLACLVCLGMVITPYVVGRRLREAEITKLKEVHAQTERHRIELAEREQAARMAEVTVRQEIARELHDIVAHSLSVMVVQAEGGRALATKRPERAQETLATIADTGREALDEMRRIVGVLRAGSDGLADGDGPAYAPAPSFADIPEMVARTGDRVRLEVRGTPHAASQAVQLTVYRVVQEAITNMLKHAGPGATADVVIDHTRDDIRVTVTDDGVGVPETFDGRGNGLKGMAERVAAMGGTLRTGPRPGGGFQVDAVVPAHPTGTQPRVTPQPRPARVSHPDPEPTERTHR